LNQANLLNLFRDYEVEKSKGIPSIAKSFSLGFNHIFEIGLAKY
jgi:hypothetical protein